MNFSTFLQTTRLGAIVLLALTPLRAQFAQLAATDDGKQLYFTSQLLPRGAAPSDLPVPEIRIYRFASGAVTLFAERGALAPQDEFGSGDGATLPQITADGSIVGFTYSNICAPNSDCTAIIGQEAQLTGKQPLDLGPGTLQLSRNGRWALLMALSGLFPQDSTLIDLTTGQRTIVPPPPNSIWFNPESPVLASDGTLLVEQPLPARSGDRFPTYTIGLWKQGQFTPLDLDAVAISDDASTIISGGLVALDLASNKRTVLLQPVGPGQEPRFMAMSANGRLVLYRMADSRTGFGPAYLANTVTGQSVAIPLPEGELVTDGTLTGGGDMAFLATTAGRIVKATFFLGGIDALFPGVPHCDDPYPVAPGALVTLHCNFTGTPATLQGELLLNDVPVPVLSTSGADIAVQIPWENHGFFGDTLAINVPSESPFQAAQTIQVFDMAPQFMLADPGQSTVLGLKLVKGDWSGLLTSQPGPGDIVYAYMTGLGYVDDPVQDGVPAPLTVPEPIVGQIACRFSPQKTAAETLFAGLAPGTIGIDQVAFRMPPDAGAAPIDGVSCSYSSPYGGAGSFGGVGTARSLRRPGPPRL
ncbi:exported hypothetical protein [Candidatus Sulfopaludibacter sp. SbA4]|nr:exported hypothetical protein [Candidatus Sulfopaludibacter sp. SbA4]